MTRPGRQRKDPGPDRLRVLMDGIEAGWLHRDKNVVTLVYDDEYRHSRLSTPLSVTLPLTQREHSGPGLTNWMANLLPDNDGVRDRWATQFKVTGSAYALLAHVGADCAGAVQFLPEDATDSWDQGGLLPLTDKDVSSRLAALEKDPAAGVYEHTRGQFSLAGAQAKMALRLADSGWAEPWGCEPTSHIFKPPMPDLAHQELNEHLCLTLTRGLGLAAAESTATSFGKQRAIVVRRYDRWVVDGQLRRLHQEDLCQALGLGPAAKYTATAKDVVELLRRQMSPARATAAVETFTRALALQWLLFATDGHAKNYSLLLQGQDVVIAPLYDINSALPYLVADLRDVPAGRMSIERARLAMPIGGRSGFSDVDGDAWRRFATDARLEPDEVIGLVEALTGAVVAAAESVVTQSLESGDLTSTQKTFVRTWGKELSTRSGLCRVALLGRTPPPTRRRPGPGPG